MYHMREEDGENFSYSDITAALVEDGHLTDEEEDLFKVQMAHVHLPKMEEKDFIEQDQRSQEIRYLPKDEVEKLIDDIKEYDEDSGF